MFHFPKSSLLNFAHNKSLKSETRSGFRLPQALGFENQPIATAQIMDNIKKTTSIITLKMYVDILRRTGMGQLLSIKGLPHDETRALRELIACEFITETLDDPMMIDQFILTPEGASALESWAAFLHENSLLYKIGGAVLRFGWVLVGALAASLSDLINKIYP